MREVIKKLNKHSISEATGISYTKLRKYSSGGIKDLSDDEIALIYNYLLETAKKFGR